MKLIIPMAGRGTRLRPHSHTTPKPLLPIAGTMMVERIVRTFSESLEKPIDEIAFVLGDFGAEVENQLRDMAGRFNAKGSIYYQQQALGTAHAVYCARESMQGEVIVAFADTLFSTNGPVKVSDADAAIWLKEVENYSSFGVALMKNGRITGFVEKPKEPVSKHAIIGVYYFKEGETLRAELTNIVENDLKSPRGEYELTDAIEALLAKGKVFRPATVQEWLDCGTIQNWLDTTFEVLKTDATPAAEVAHSGCTIHEPVYVGQGAILENCEIGPNAVIESGAVVRNSSIKSSIINKNALVENAALSNSSVGVSAVVKGYTGSLHVGDHSQVGTHS
ncbi:MAG: NTP transferase domain-containing protein [Candidatus Cyclonatronum sp.]|uniref:sugar phosphate nucleotidyltransferase n=1 Tax=Cyclonatronum sp. TaxID=3024185 RepID=UPI0025BF090A|nr:sugar phosphate nucleotidyltransferase [Cyclonatronum sp.]MCH8486509.1 NTP transferase domain-containing protein [Cyclonatronum sp.]